MMPCDAAGFAKTGAIVDAVQPAPQKRKTRCSAEVNKGPELGSGKLALSGRKWVVTTEMRGL